MARHHKIRTCELTENMLFLQTDEDSIGDLLEEKLDFHEVLNECTCLRILQSDVFHQHPIMESSHSDCCSILYYNSVVAN